MLNYKNFVVITKKIFDRLFGYKQKNYNNYIKFLREISVNHEEFFNSIDAELWKESKIASEEIINKSNKIIKNINYDLGGGGAIDVIYFLTRYSKPEIILETGVAAGFSSYAFLKSIYKNNYGTLYSSDFPYFRLPKPEKYIGIVVPEEFKSHWNLFIEGDQYNIELIKKKINKVDLIHYDSDKSYNGRKNFTKSIEKLMHDQTLFLMDDLHNNEFFIDYVKEKNLFWKILNINNRYVGFIYPKNFLQ